MFIAVINEPRSGSTNLIKWFSYLKNFTVWISPSYVASEWPHPNISPKDYEYPTEHLIIKEDFFVDKNFDELIRYSDKQIILYRENEIEQTESWVASHKTGCFQSHYRYRKVDSVRDREEEKWFKKLKQQFFDNYIKDGNLFKISYEELYFKNGFQKIVDHINLDEVKNEGFPIGEKYRILDENVVISPGISRLKKYNIIENPPTIVQGFPIQNTSDKNKII